VKVLHLTFAYPTPQNPGNGIFVRDHVLAAARSNEVALVHLDRGGGAYAIEPLAGEDFPALRVRYPSSRLGYVAHFAGAYAALRRLRRSGFEPDVIHAHFFLAALPPLLLRSLFRAPVVVTEQWSVFLPEDPARLSPFFVHVARIALRRAAFVITVSDALRRGMVAAGIRANYRIVPNVVDVQLFRPEPHEPGRPRRLVFVGLLYEAKGVPDLLRAVAALASRRDFVLELVGDGPQRREYEQLAASLGLADVVHFLGFRTRREVADLLRKADLFVLTSLYDNNPNALLEALACGVPAVATRVGGIPEIVGAGDGLLAEPGDPVSIAKAIAAALDHLERFDHEAIALAARRRFGPEAVGAALNEIYAAAGRDAR
jgi:glycosyltransferase involved in cell wall biosynthesis